MNKKTLLFLTALLISTNLFADKVLTKAEIEQFKSEFPATFGNSQDLTILKGLKRDKFRQFEVMTPSGQTFDIFAVEGVPEAIFAGNAYDKDGNRYSFPKDVAIIKNGVAFKVGKGPRQIYIVTDPECPYCQRLEQNLDVERVYKEYTINIIPMPLSNHPSAKPMYYWVFAAKTDAEKGERLRAIMLGDEKWRSYTPTTAEVEVGTILFRKGLDAAREIKATGTPAVFDADFNPINYNFLLKN